MSSGIEQISRIEEKLNRLLSEHQQLLRENQKLRSEQGVQIETQKQLKAKVDELEVEETPISGCYIVRFPNHIDTRGYFQRKY